MCQTTDGTVTNGKLPPAPAGAIPGAESIRDGATTNTPSTLTNAADATTVDANVDKGHHESEMYYFECQTRSRNKGLFLADQTLNGQSAQYTRQNPNGNRRGLECPEERDYYPYWSPSPWKDVVILTDHVAQKCNADGTYNGNSQNTVKVRKCVPDDITAAGATAAIAAITDADCATAGGSIYVFRHNLPAPKCQQVDWSRVNHLGNGRFGQPLTYNWTLPTIATLVGPGVPQIYTYTDGTTQYAKCVARLRYNISTVRRHTDTRTLQRAKRPTHLPAQPAADEVRSACFALLLLSLPLSLSPLSPG